jgi:hypothetical protein
MGDSEDKNNDFRWDTVELNLPGDLDYNPALAWVRKVREEGEIAADIHDYVDDNRETAPSEEEAWQAASKVAKTIAFYGSQDAPLN